MEELKTGTRAFALYLNLSRGQDAGVLEPVSIVRVTPHPPDAWHLRRFGVLPDYRGRGIGTTLLNLVEREATRVGVRRLMLHCVVERFLVPYYQRRGFKVTNIVPHTDKPLTVATMEKELSGDLIAGVRPGFIAAPEWDILPQGGLYVLWLYLAEMRTIRIGSLGECSFDKGVYAYIGSGVRRLSPRLRRHWTGARNLRWHIDWLRAVATPVGIDILPNSPPVPSECDLASSLSAVPGVVRFIPRFGASDCRCAGHLFSMPQDSTAYFLPRSWEGRLFCCYREPSGAPEGG